MSDDGPALGQAEQSPVVGPRAHGSEAREDHVRGNRLGLGIVASVVTAHGGDLTVANVSGGCRFELHLPTALAGSAVGARDNPAA